VAAGSAWMTLVSRMNAELQLFLPNWVRARGLAVYQVVFAGCQALGAFVWGQLTSFTDLRTTYLVAAAAMIAGTISVRWLPLYEQEGIDRGPVGYWAEPHLMLEPHLDTGPVLVTAAYRVPTRNRRAFVAAMEAVRRARLRTGATRWVLFRDGEDPEQYVEVFVVPTWEEHLRQHELGGGDVAADERAVELAEGPPRVTHLLPPDSSD